MTSEEMQELIYKTIENISQGLLNKTNYLYVVEGKITEVDSLGNGYVFEYQSEKYNGFSITGETYSVDDLVYVLFSNNKNIKKMILSKTKNFSNNDINRFVKKTNKSISEIKLENDEISLSVKNNEDAISQININLDGISLSVQDNKEAISQIKIENEQISLEVSGKVGKDEVISCINQTPESITIKAQKISLEGVVTANNYFQILEDGSMRAVNSDFSGTITATEGKIGRYDITSTYLMTGSGSTATGMGGNQAFWAGASDSDSAPFRVSYNGALYSIDATIQGNVKGSTITGSTISGGSASYERTRTITVYSDDLQKIMNEVLYPGTMSASDKIRLDVDNSGYISSRDYVIVKNILDGTESKTWIDYVYINKDDPYVIIGSKSSINKGNPRETIIRPGSICLDRIRGYDYEDIGISFSGDSLVIDGKITIHDRTSTAGSTEIWTEYYNNSYNSYFTNRSSGYLALKVSSGSNDIEALYLNPNTDSSTYSAFFHPLNDGKCTLGRASKTFYRLYSKLDTSVTSDIRLKTNIKNYDERFEKMYMDLKPITYELISVPGQSQCGLIAQWTKESMDKFNIKEKEFGIYQYDKETDNYSITYGQITSLNMHMIQKSILRIDSQDTEISKLKDKIAQLQSKLDAYINNEIETRSE